jgi:hypothetical protein
MKIKCTKCKKEITNEKNYYFIFIASLYHGYEKIGKVCDRNAILCEKCFAKINKTIEMLGG